MWTYDLAREQSPTTEHLDRLCRLSTEAGYDALGIYLEHRFAYASAPWAAGRGALTPETVAWLRREHPSLRLIPFANLLGHMEGFLYASGGEGLAEERFKGMQAAPSNPRVAAFARGLLDDVMRAFDDEIVHIGGDETQQLAASAARTGESEADLYGGYFGPMAAYVLSQGRRPAVWGDMFPEHPSALDALPKETLVFDWQYFGSPRETARRFIDAGHEVVLSPTVHVYDAAWCHLPQTEQNVRDHAAAASALGAYGVCVTTWEGALFASYETLLPAIAGCGEILRAPSSSPRGTDSKEISLPSGAEEGIGGGENTNPLDVRKTLSLNGNPQLPDPYEASPQGTTQSVQIADAIIAQYLAGKIRRAEFAYELGNLKITFDGKPNGQLPMDLAPETLRRLGLIAGMDPLKHRQSRVGKITGTFDGEPFEFAAESFPINEGIAFTLTRTPPPPSSSTDIGFASAEFGSRVDEEGAQAYADLREAPTLLRAYLKAGERHEEWARLMGVELLEAGGPFAFTGIRSALKARLLLYGNPFLLWLRNREDLLGEPGDKALAILDRAIAFAPDSAYRGVSEFTKIAIQNVRFMEESAVAYAAGKPGVAAAALAPIRLAFDDLARIAKGTNIRIGGSLADIERCTVAKEHVERVMRRIKQYGDGSLGYLPSYETICHPKFMPHDQANWWLINTWANE